MGEFSSILWVMTPACSTISVIIVLFALVTNDWLRTEEIIKNSRLNVTDDDEILYKRTSSGIWRICVTGPEKMEEVCNAIQYLTVEEHSQDPHDPAVAIPQAVRQSAFFFIVASVVQFSGELSYLYGHYIKRKMIFIFISGTIFIVSGLVMLIGIIMYISLFKSEIGSKLEISAYNYTPPITYEYGISLLFYVMGFLMVEMSGTCAILLYVNYGDSVHIFSETQTAAYSPHSASYANPAPSFACKIHPENNILIPTCRELSPCRVISNNEINQPQVIHIVPESPPYLPVNRSSFYGKPKKLRRQHDNIEWLDIQYNPIRNVSTQANISSSYCDIHEKRILPESYHYYHHYNSWNNLYPVYYDMYDDDHSRTIGLQTTAFDIDDCRRKISRRVQAATQTTDYGLFIEDYDEMFVPFNLENYKPLSKSSISPRVRRTTLV